MSDTDDHAIIALKNICDFVSTKMLIVISINLNNKFGGEPANNLIVEKDKDAKYGARPLRCFFRLQYCKVTDTAGPNRVLGYFRFCEFL